MNGYQRICAALKGEWADTRPIFLHSFMFSAHDAGYTVKQFGQNPEIVAECFIQTVEKYGIDGIMLDIDTAILAHAVGVPVDFPDDEPGRAYDKCIDSLEEIDNLEPVDISKNIRVQVLLESARLLKKYCGDEIFLRGNCDQAPFSLASMMRTPGLWMTDLLFDPERAHKLLDYCSGVCLQMIDLMAMEDVHMISNGDSPAGPEMVSPEMFREFALPYEKKLVERAHEKGLPYMNHICGNTELILEDMPKTGLDAIELDYKTSVIKIHDLYKDSVILSGNIDPSGVFAHGTPELMKKKVRELLKIYEDSPRLIVNAGCALPSNTPPENVRAFVKAVREY